MAKNEFEDLGFVPDSAPADDHSDLGFVPDKTVENSLRSTAGSLAKKMDDAGDSIISGAKDFAMGGGQGLTLGFGDEALGGLQALKDVTVGDKKLADLAKLYRQHQQENEKSWEDAKSRSPWLTFGGELAGGALLGGPLGLLGKEAEAASLGQKVLKGMGVGAVAGVGGSKGTIEENPEQIAKDAAFSSAFGGAVPVALNRLGAAGSKVKDMVEDTPLAKKLAATFDYVKNRGYNFSGKNATTDVEKEIMDASKSVASQFSNGIKDTQDMYGDVLKTAGDNGAALSTADTDLMSAFKAFRGKDGRYAGGLTPENEALLNKHGTPVFDPETATMKMQALTPREAKNLELGLRELGQKPSYETTSTVKDLEKALSRATADALPESELSHVNRTFGAMRDVAAPLVNKGETDPNFQKLGISDIDPSQLNGKMNDYITQLIKKSQDGNVQGAQARAKLSNILGNLKRTNELNQTQFVDPAQVSSQVEHAGLLAGILKGFQGDRSSDTIGKIGGVMDAVTSVPYHVVQVAAKGARAIDRSPVADVARTLYSSSDAALKTVAQQLDQNGLGHMGAALNQALENKSEAAKNAALFTIMQNPKSRQIITGSSDGNGQGQGN